MSKEKFVKVQNDYMGIIGNKQNKNETIHNIQRMMSYRKTLTPLFDQQNQWKVQKKAKLDKEAYYKFNQRQSDNKLYLQYDINPFYPYKKKQKHELLKQINKSKQKVVQLVEILTPKDNNKKKIKKQMMQNINKLQNIRKQADLRSQKILNVIKSYQNKQKKNQIISQNTVKPPLDENSLLSNMELQDIVNIKQNRYMFQKQQKPNIFQLVRDQDECIGMLDYLHKYNFCFDSHIERNYKIRIPIYRQLSTMGRHVSSNCYNGKQKILNFVFSDQLTLNMKELSFGEILCVANNRFSAQFLYNKLYDENTKPVHEGSQDMSQDQPLDQKIILRKTDRIQFNNFVGGDQEIDEIFAYKKIQLRKPEELYEKRNKDKGNQIIQQLQRQNQLCLNNIMDMKLHSTMGDNANQKLKKFIANKQTKNIQFERLVRQKKKINDKKQIIRLRQFKRMLEQRNKHSKIKSSLSRGKLNNTVHL